jgi:hypothetical protein
VLALHCMSLCELCLDFVCLSAIGAVSVVVVLASHSTRACWVCNQHGRHIMSLVAYMLCCLALPHMSAALPTLDIAEARSTS